MHKQKNAFSTGNTKGYYNANIPNKKNSTASADKNSKSSLNFNSFNNVIQNNQSVDFNNSRKLSNNPSPGNSVILASGTGKMTRNKYTNSYAAIHQEKLNRSRQSKDDSLNASKRLNTNSSQNKNNVDDYQTHQPLTQARIINKNIASSNKNVSFPFNNIPKPRHDSLSSGNVSNKLNKNNSKSNLNATNINNANSNNNNVTFNNKEHILYNTNPNNQSVNIQTNIQTNPETGGSNIYVNSKNSQKNANSENNKESSAKNLQSLKSNSTTKINYGNNKEEQLKNFAMHIAATKGKQNIYDIIKGNNKAKSKSDNKINTSITNSNKKMNASKNNISLSNSNSNIRGSIEFSRIPNDNNPNLLMNSENFDVNQLQKISERNSISNNNNVINITSARNSINYNNSPLKPIKNDANNLNSSIGFSSIELIKTPQIGAQSPQQEINKLLLSSAENKVESSFNKYKNNKTNSKVNSKTNSLEILNSGNSSSKNLESNLNRNVNIPQEDDFDFNYNDEKIYSENQIKMKRNNTIEDGIPEYFDKNESIKDNIENNTNNNVNPTNMIQGMVENEKEKVINENPNLNKFNHMRSKSNFNFSNEPLTSIEEIDEKVNLQNTEENIKPTKDIKENISATTPNTVMEIMRSNKKNEKNIEENNSFNFNKANEIVTNEINKPTDHINSKISSPTKKVYKNELEEINGNNINPNNLINNVNNLPVNKTEKNQSINNNINTNKEFSKEPNKKPASAKSFDFSSQGQEMNRQTNLTSTNISPINNPIGAATSEIKQKNDINNDFSNITPIIKSKDPEEVYKRARVSRKSNEIEELVALNNLIDIKPENNQQKEKRDSKITQEKLFKKSLSIKTQLNTKIEKPSSSKIVNTYASGKNKNENQNSPNKTLTKHKTLTSIGNPTKKPDFSSNTNVKNKVNPNTSNGFDSLKINKDEVKKGESSIFDEFSNNININNNAFGGESLNNSNILTTNQSKNNLKTAINDINSSRTFSKTLTEKEVAAAAIAAGKLAKRQKTVSSSNLNFKKTNTLNKNDKSLINDNNPNTSRQSLRKSFTISNKNNLNDKSQFKNNFNKTINNNNTTLNMTLSEGKKRTNFISKDKLKSTKSLAKNNKTEIKNSTRISRKSILGKILSTRSIRGDDRTKNILSGIENSPKHSRNNFNSPSQMSLSSFRDSFDYEYNRRFLSIGSHDDLTYQKHNRSFPNKFLKKKYYKKNESFLLGSEDQLNKSNGSIYTGALASFIKLRINENIIVSREKLKPKTKRGQKLSKGRYEFIESLDSTFKDKRLYNPDELLISHKTAYVAINEKDEEKEMNIMPPNYRKEQKDEINSRLSEKLQGNFIDESVTKITKMNRLERMRNNRYYSSISMSPTKTMNNLLFSPLTGPNARQNPNNLNSSNLNNIVNDKQFASPQLHIRENSNGQNMTNSIKKDLNRNIMKNNNFYSNHNISPDARVSDIIDKSENLFSDRTLKYSINDDSNINNNYGLYHSNNNNANINNYNNENSINSFIKAEKKIGNSKVVLMENNFMICSDEDKVFSPFDSYIENNFLSNNLGNNNIINNNPIAEHLEMKSKTAKRFEKLENFEKISNAVFNITKQKHIRNESMGTEKPEIEGESALVRACTFTLNHFENKNHDNNSNNKGSSTQVKKILEAQNVINLFYQMHPEKNKFGIYSFMNNNEEYYTNAFSLMKNPNSRAIGNNTLNYSLHISNAINESINPHLNLSNNLLTYKNDPNLKINTSNFAFEKSQNNNCSNTNTMPSKLISQKKISFEISQTNKEATPQAEEQAPNPVNNLKSSQQENLPTETYSLTFANSNQSKPNPIPNEGINNEILSNINIMKNSNNNEIIKKSLAENIRNQKDDADIFDKVKGYIEAKRVMYNISEQENLNNQTRTINVNNTINNPQNLNTQSNVNPNNIKARALLNLNKLENISKSQEKSTNASNLNSLENPNKLKEALIKINDDNFSKLQIAETHRLVQPMNTRPYNITNNSNNTNNLCIITESSEKNTCSDAQLELLSEKIKKEKQMEYLNQKFHEKLNAMKNTKILETQYEQDNEFEHFKNEFKRKNNMHNNGDKKNNLEEFNFFSPVAYSSSSKIKQDTFFNDEQLSEFKDKFFGKFEFIDKDNLNQFYSKYLKNYQNKADRKKPKNICVVTYQEESHKNNILKSEVGNINYTSINNSNAANKEKELSIRLAKLKNMLQIDEYKKKKELKSINSQVFLYENTKGNVNNPNEKEYLNNLNSSILTNAMNDSKLLTHNNNNNHNVSSSSHNNKYINNISTVKLSNLPNTTNKLINNLHPNIDINKILSLNANLNIPSKPNTSKNELTKEKKFNF